MYLQITTRCNMECPHCGFSCGYGRGKDMPMSVVHNAIELIKCMESWFITIGGGEPTLHPQLWEILGLIFSTRDINSESGNVLIITNGKEQETVEALAYLGKQCAISLEMSVDEYHEWVDQDLVDMFGKNRQGCLSIRDVTNRVVPTGRGKHLTTKPQTNCVCSDFIVTPSGDIKFCGCEDSPIIDKLTSKNIDSICSKLTQIHMFFTEIGKEQCIRNFDEKEFKQYLEDELGV